MSQSASVADSAATVPDFTPGVATVSSVVSSTVSSSAATVPGITPGVATAASDDRIAVAPDASTVPDTTPGVEEEGGFTTVVRSARARAAKPPEADANPWAGFSRLMTLTNPAIVCLIGTAGKSVVLPVELIIMMGIVQTRK